MTTLARKRPSSVIQVTVKQTETDPGLIGVVSVDLKMDIVKTLSDLHCVCISTWTFLSSSTQDCSKSDEVKTVEGTADILFNYMI